LSFLLLVVLLRRRLPMRIVTFHLTVLGAAVSATLLGSLISADAYAFEARVAIQMTVMAVVGMDAALIYRSINLNVLKGTALWGDRPELNDQQIPLGVAPTAIAEGKG
jgi:hypothetical protein